MRRGFRLVAVLVVLAVSAPAAQVRGTRPPRAPSAERLSGERLSFVMMAADRRLVFPCQPMGTGCASNPLGAGRMVFEGDGWAGYQLCRAEPAGERCVTVDEAFAR